MQLSASSNDLAKYPSYVSLFDSHFLDSIKGVAGDLSSMKVWLLVRGRSDAEVLGFICQIQVSMNSSMPAECLALRTPIPTRQVVPSL